MTSRALHAVVTCEHGGNRVPARYRPLFRGHERVLASHRGYDPGSLELARRLARRLGAPLYASRVSRLLVELNRSPGHPRLFSKITRALPAEERKALFDHYYVPHRRAVERGIAGLVGRGQRVLHVASHSFTPRLHGTPRTADVAWLYDPSRPEEKRLAREWRFTLSSVRPDLRLRFNYPYRGVSDGLTTYLRSRFGARYLGIELEVNQRFFLGDADESRRIQGDIVSALVRVLRARAK